MNATVYNRITRRTEALPGRLVGGIWQAGGAGRLNGLPVLPGTPLVPDARGQLTWQPEGLAADSPLQGRFPGVEAAGLQMGSLEDALTTLLTRGGGWGEWTALSPLDRNLADDLRRLPLEEEMERHLDHLGEVCRQPRTHLEIFEERQPVSRARQVPTRAITYLASHTEDWEARTLRSVRPRRIIANVRDDRYDIYENRVAVRLVDHLLRYVRRRIARVAELLRTLEVVEANAHEPPSGMHWRQRRLYSLWGDALDVTEGQLLGEERLEALQHLRRRLERLQDSVLYRRVHRRLQVPAQLRVTNILGNDPHYRRVERLWRAWYRHAHTGQPSPREQQRAAQEQAGLLNGYGLLLTIQALAQFDFTPAAGEGGVLHPGAGLRLTGPEGEVTLRWEADGTHVLQRGGEQLMRVVPLTTPLAALTGGDRRWVTGLLAGAARDAEGFTLLLYPGSSLPAPAPEFLALGTDPGALHPRLGCLPVSPVDLESTERVARALRWVLTGGRYLTYPPRVPLPGPLQGTPAPSPFQGAGGDWVLPVPLAPGDDAWQQPREGLRAELARVERNLAALGTAGHNTRATRREADRLRQALDAWETLAAGVREAGAALQALRRCPVCSCEGAAFQAWADSQFHCRCDDCGATWSLHRCPTCRARRPWLRPRLREQPAIDPGAGWADRLYGRDVLTLPSPHDLADEACPTCAVLTPAAG